MPAARCPHSTQAALPACGVPGARCQFLGSSPARPAQFRPKPLCRFRALQGHQALVATKLTSTRQIWGSPDRSVAEVPGQLCRCKLENEPAPAAPRTITAPSPQGLWTRSVCARPASPDGQASHAAHTALQLPAMAVPDVPGRCWKTAVPAADHVSARPVLAWPDWRHRAVEARHVQELLGQLGEGGARIRQHPLALGGDFPTLHGRPGEAQAGRADLKRGAACAAC